MQCKYDKPLVCIYYKYIYRSSCGIVSESGYAFIVTGGVDDGNRVTLYYSSGNYYAGGDLNVGRSFHGCGFYRNDIDLYVCRIILNTYYDITGL